MNNYPEEIIRPEVRRFSAYSPGLGIDEIKARYGLTSVIKMASNENPLGVSPVVQEVLRKNAALSFRYPAAGNPDLCRSLGSYLEVDSKRIVCGNGSDEIIDLLIRITAVPGRDNIVAFKPCFSIYKLQSGLCGVEFRQCPLGADFSFDWSGLLKLVDDHTRIVFLTNPDNPSGNAVSAEKIKEFFSLLPDSAILVIDEAYIDFAAPMEKFSSINMSLVSDRIVVLRTFSKMFGLAGLRLGFAVLPEFLADYLLRVRLPFSVNILAEKAGVAALEDNVFRQATLDLISSGRQYLTKELERLGCRVFPSQANFLMFRPPKNADTVFKELLKQGIIIRPLKSYGLPDFLRISMGTQKENQLFLKTLKDILDA